jgi:CheY-like chemotaxis protein
MALVIVVEDDVGLGTILARLLGGRKHEVRVVTEGSAALRLIGARPPDLMITDILMPGVDGLETIMRTRQIAPAVKIIAMSGDGGSSRPDFLAMARKLGADALLRKPFGNAELIELVDRLLGPGGVAPAG